jgi:hypothetical protein
MPLDAALAGALAAAAIQKQLATTRTPFAIRLPVIGIPPDSNVRRQIVVTRRAIVASPEYI